MKDTQTMEGTTYTVWMDNPNNHWQHQHSKLPIAVLDMLNMEQSFGSDSIYVNEYVVTAHGSYVLVETYLHDRKQKAVVRESTGLPLDTAGWTFSSRINFLLGNPTPVRSRKQARNRVTRVRPTSIPSVQQSQAVPPKPVEMVLEKKIPVIESSESEASDDDENSRVDAEENLEDLDLNELEKKIRDLEAQEEKQKEEIEKAKEVVNGDSHNLVKFQTSIREEEREVERLKEMELERGRIFESDIGVYHKFMEKVKKGHADINKPPPMFASKYGIFQFMDKHGYLDGNESYPLYLLMFNELYQEPDDSDYDSDNVLVPFKINYLMDEKLEEIKDAYPELAKLANEFGSSTKNAQLERIGSFDAVMKKLDEESSDSDDTAPVDEEQEASDADDESSSLVDEGVNPSSSSESEDGADDSELDDDSPVEPNAKSRVAEIANIMRKQM